ncbi:vitamin K-dependent protein C-like [Cydia splendana]|uniref:vitamin K-dependent protein C-like n=1 Tax=Cydia splendana TaxID=1100963 RepID=UPI00300D8BEB
MERCGVPHRYLSEYSRSGRLLGGETTTAHQFPWLAAVNIASRSIGGSLISDRHIVTAASPLYGKSFNEVSVTLGAHDRCGNGSDPVLNTSVSDIIIHPGFSPTNRDNDIALLKLRHVVPFGRFISPICMPHYGGFLTLDLIDSRHGAPESGQVAWTAAWTGTDNNESCTPRVATLPILPTRSCLKDTVNSNFVTPDKGCLGPLGARNIICEADVGAPIMQRHPGFSFRLAGVVSSSSCDRITSPLYTRIIDHAGWVYQHTHSDCQCL